MGRREVTQYFDDLDQTPLKADEVRTAELTFNGQDYAIDLSQENYAKFEEALRPYLEVAHRVTRAGGRSASGSSARPRANAERNRKVRAWARENNIEVSDRGRIAAEVYNAYDAAH